MPPFTIQEHTADVRLNVTGHNLQELFSSAIEGLVAIMAPEGQASAPGESVSFALEAPDRASLLIDFLNEALFFMQTRRVTITTVDFSILNKSYAEGNFIILPVASFGEDVKAVTYHDVKFHRRSDGGLETAVVLDI